MNHRGGRQNAEFRDRAIPMGVEGAPQRKCQVERWPNMLKYLQFKDLSARVIALGGSIRRRIRRRILHLRSEARRNWLLRKLISRVRIVFFLLQIGILKGRHLLIQTIYSLQLINLDLQIWLLTKRIAYRQKIIDKRGNDG